MSFICLTGALGAALEQCSRSICRAAAREALSQEEISLIEQMAEAIEASRNPESPVHFERHAHIHFFGDVVTLFAAIMLPISPAD